MRLSLHGMKRKWLILALLPFIGAMATIAIAVAFQAKALSNSEHREIAAAYRSSKEVELKNYVALAESAVAPLYNSGRDDPATRAEALAILSKLEFGSDGYFFVYDLQGDLLMHPRLAQLVGTNLCPCTILMARLPFNLSWQRLKAAVGLSNIYGSVRRHIKWNQSLVMW